MKISYRNGRENSIYIVIEPWARDYEVPPSSTLHLTLTGEYEADFLFDDRPQEVAVLYVVSDGIDVEIEAVNQ